MKIKDYKCKCGYDDFFFSDKGNQKGIYCSYCGKWLKWADKDEQNLAMKSKQECILDKIRAEIKELDNKVCQQFLIEDVDKEVHHAYQDCLGIIDKVESEDK